MLKAYFKVKTVGATRDVIWMKHKIWKFYFQVRIRKPSWKCSYLHWALNGSNIWAVTILKN